MAQISCQTALQLILDEIDHLVKDCQLWGQVPPFCTALIRYIPYLDRPDKIWLQKKLQERMAVAPHEQVKAAYKRVIDELEKTVVSASGSRERSARTQGAPCGRPTCVGCSECIECSGFSSGPVLAD